MRWKRRGDGVFALGFLFNCLLLDVGIICTAAALNGNPKVRHDENDGLRITTVVASD